MKILVGLIVASGVCFGQIIPVNVKAFWHFGDAFNASVIADSTGRGNNLTPYLRINTTNVPFMLANTELGQHLMGAMKGWGHWNRLLTPTEKTAIAGGEYYPFTATPSLQSGLLVYYLLDEAGGSASYADATGRGNTLTASGTTTRVVGPNGGGDNATDFGTTAYLFRNSPGSDLQTGQAVVTVAGWVKLNSKPAATQQCFWCQIKNSTADSGFNVYTDTTSDRFALDNDAGAGNQLNQGSFVLDNNFGSPSTGVWYNLISEFDYAANRITIATNNGTLAALNNELQPIPVVGKVGNGSQFALNPSGDFPTRTSGWDQPPTVAGNNHAFMTATADISFGANAKTVWGWFKTTDFTTTQTVMGSWLGTAITTDWIMQISAGTVIFVMGHDQANLSVPMTDTNWHLIVAWFDPVGNVIHLNLDNGAQVATHAGPTTPATSTVLVAGAQAVEHVSNSNQFLGILNVWGIASGNPTTGDLNTLWNGGNGYNYVAPTKTVGFIGDSITNCFGQTVPNCAYVQSTSDLTGWVPGSSYAYVNQGVDGSRSFNWLSGGANLNAALAAFAAATPVVSEVWIQIGTNDALTAVRTSQASFQANVLNTITALKAAGVSKIVLNGAPYIIPTAFGGIWDTQSNTVYLPAYQAAIIALANNDPTHVFVGTQQAFPWFQANQSFLADGVHPTAAGQVKLGDIWAPAALLGRNTMLPCIVAR